MRTTSVKFHRVRSIRVLLRTKQSVRWRESIEFGDWFRYDPHGQHFTDSLGRLCSRFDRRLHCSQISSYAECDNAATEKFRRHEGDSRGFSGRIGRFNRGDQSARFN